MNWLCLVAEQQLKTEPSGKQSIECFIFFQESKQGGILLNETTDLFIKSEPHEVRGILFSSLRMNGHLWPFKKIITY